MKKILYWLTAVVMFSHCCSLYAQTLGTFNGKTVGSTSGNLSTINGKTLGTASGNMSKWNNANSPSSGSGPSFSLPTAQCTGTGTTSASCALASSGKIGDLLFVISKSSSNDSGATVAWSFSGTSSCTLTSLLAPDATTWQDNGSGHFITSASGCIITATGTNTPVATWTGTDGSFTDIEAFTISTTSTWKSTFLDTVLAAKATTSTTACPATAITTTNANDFVVAVCQVFNAGQTWGTLSGYTNAATASRNTTGIYYKSVSATGSQTATVPLSAADYGLSFIISFASNP